MVKRYTLLHHVALLRLPHRARTGRVDTWVVHALIVALLVGPTTHLHACKYMDSFIEPGVKDELSLLEIFTDVTKRDFYK